ncbi:hypothetical protein [Thiothrix sp.]|jgi:hypothetical protein|uniref:hypothetical protein n=1 Tax=Thiothrix sp. TaxID=1032 RepID=UPI00257EE822|nr:hypothetical protein [Thiothrix sp.]
MNHNSYAPPLGNIQKQIDFHRADFIACTQAANECDRWMMEYLVASYHYRTAAAHAAGELSRVLQLKWDMGVNA